MARPPNILVMMTDQQRGDMLGCSWPAWRGGPPPVHTPHLDRLAAEGVRCARHHVSNPLCMPQRSTLLTGLTPRGHGVRTNGIDLDPKLPTLPGLLGGAGYRTHSVGKIHARVYDLPRGADPATLDPADYPEANPMWNSGRIASLPTPYYGFQSADFTGGHTSWIWGDYAAWLTTKDPAGVALLSADRGTRPANGAEQTWKMAIDPALHYTTWIADRAIGFLETAATAEAPFYLSVSFPDPHHGFACPDPWYSMFDRTAMPAPVRREGELDDLAPHYRTVFTETLPLSGRHAPTRIGDDQLREIRAVTAGMIAMTDDGIGRVLAALDRLNLAGDTIVLFLADHGDMLGDHWMMNKGPFHFDGLLRVPFLARWPGRIPAGRVVESLTSHTDVVPTLLAMTGVAPPDRWPSPATSAEARRELRALPGRSLVPVLTGAAGSVQDAVVIENDEDYLGLRLRTIVTQDRQLTMYVGEDGEQPYGELFDLDSDPGQLRNRWVDPAWQTEKSRLKERLLAELIRTDSRLPRRHGHA